MIDQILYIMWLPKISRHAWMLDISYNRCLNTRDEQWWLERNFSPEFATRSSCVHRIPQPPPPNTRSKVWLILTNKQSVISNYYANCLQVSIVVLRILCKVRKLQENICIITFVNAWKIETEHTFTKRRVTEFYTIQ
jgi:hypothetical protein